MTRMTAEKSGIVEYIKSYNSHSPTQMHTLNNKFIAKCGWCHFLSYSLLLTTQLVALSYTFHTFHSMVVFLELICFILCVYLFLFFGLFFLFRFIFAFAGNNAI